jgi:hypothetical protein
MKHSIAILLLVLLATTASAADMWVVQGHAFAGTGDPCTLTVWNGDVLFHNTTDAAATVTLLGVSDGPAVGTNVPSFTIPPHRTITLQAKIGAVWQPVGAKPIWIDHLDVPAGVLVESRLEIGSQACFGLPVPIPFFGKVSFPVVRALTPAGERKVHLGSDLGAVDARVNVGVYNGGQSTAGVTIEVRRACDDAILDRKQITLAANGFVQTTLSPGAPNVSRTSPCFGSTDATLWATYTTVVADQPTLSYASTLANTIPDSPVVKVPYAVTFSQ